MASEFVVKIGLKPCPFCGEAKDIRNEPNIYEEVDGKVVQIARNRKRRHPTRYIVKCGKCFAHTIWAETQEDAFAFWQAELFDKGTEMVNGPYRVSREQVQEAAAEIRNEMIKTLFDDLKAAYVDKYSHNGRGAVAGEAWFRSEELSAWTDIDGEAIIRAAKQQARYELWRIKHGCKGCRKTHCMHSNGKYPWTKFANGTADDCPIFRGGFIDDAAQARLDRAMWCYLQWANGVDQLLWNNKKYTIS